MLVLSSRATPEEIFVSRGVGKGATLSDKLHPWTWFLFIQHILIERTLTMVTAMDRHDLYLHQDYSI